MNRKEILWKILREEYGINSMKELDDAIKKQKKIDISIFCAKPVKKEKAG